MRVIFYFSLVRINHRTDLNEQAALLNRHVAGLREPVVRVEIYAEDFVHDYLTIVTFLL